MKEKQTIIAILLLVLSQMNYDIFAFKSVGWSVFWFSFLYLSLAFICAINVKKNSIGVLWLALSCTFILRFGFTILAINSDYNKFIESVNSLQINTILVNWCIFLLIFAGVKIKENENNN